MAKITLFLVVFLLLFSCAPPKKPADILVYNADVYTVDESTPRAKGFAIKDGAFLELGNAESLLEKYTFTHIVDAKGKTILPGLIDAHCHFYNLGLQQRQVDLTGTKSYDEVLNRIVAFQKEKKVSFITGGGWDQNDWEVKEYPTRRKLDSLFPHTPVAVTRIDGHAMLVNTAVLRKAKISRWTKIEGGQVLKTKYGIVTGVLIDNAMQLAEKIMPKPSRRDQEIALLNAQAINVKYGLTTVDDAGLSPEVIAIIDDLQKKGKLKIRIYAMVSSVPEYVDQYLEKGIYKTERLNVSSFKVFADGALGSRGAVLKQPYSDKENHHGSMLIGVTEFKELAKKLANSSFQMNTHAIGDSANALVMNTYYDVLKNETNRRWRVEHAQVIAPKEFQRLDNKLIMSVQPTHATSDMYWAGERLGEERMKGAYAYKKLLNKTGRLALGTDYPVENVSPFHTFYAAVARKDLQQYPEGGFQKEDALTREEALKGMTLWAAYANFEEMEKGSISVGKLADFVIIDQNIMEIQEDAIPDTQVIATYINGEKVY